MHNIRCRGRGLLALAALVATGCGGGEDHVPVFGVTGTVTHNGNPLEGAVVTFSPVGDGPASVGTTDADGKYQLTTYAQGDGAPTGSYRIAIARYENENSQAPSTEVASAELDPTDPNFDEYGEGYDEMEASDAPPSENVLAAKYASPETSGFEAQVTENVENNVFDFELED